MAKIPARLENHPSVRAVRERPVVSGPKKIDAGWLRKLCLEAGADDVGFVSIDHPDLAGEVDYARNAMPGVRSCISLVLRMNRDNVRSPARSLANKEFHQAAESVDEAMHDIVRVLQDEGYRAVNPSATFPMEMGEHPNRIWVIQHKTVAVAAGMGAMGIHRNVIHPRYGNFILLGTILVDAEISEYGEALDYNPCLECKLCVAVCPVGAISKTGEFDWKACSTHNYREFLNGFTEFVETIADSKDGDEYRERVSDTENLSMWQSLAFKPNYKAAYCLSVCPAGEDVLGPYLEDRRAFLGTVVKPLQEKEEPVYVAVGSDTGEYVQKRFPNKRPVEVTGGRRVRKDA